MKNNNQNVKNTIILGALLHDIGKFWERARERDENGNPIENLGSEFEEVTPKPRHYHARWSAQFTKENQFLFSDPEKIIDLALYHSNPRKENINDQFVEIADKLSSMERRMDETKDVDEIREFPKSWEVPLISIFNRINLTEERKNHKLEYNLNPLSLNKDIIFPIKIGKFPRNAYKESLKVRIEKDLKDLRNIRISQDDILTLYYLLYKYLWCIPSAAPSKDEKRVPDISLFDHAKTTAAIAVCLSDSHKLYDVKNLKNLKGALREEYKKKKGSAINAKNKTLSPKYEIILKEPFFCQVSGDISGIQNFIYSISQHKSAPGVSKRLRGRSFYLTLMTEIFARYLLRVVNYPITNLLYCGGGRFDILLPNNKEIVQKIDKAISEINEYLLENFYGELGIIVEKKSFGCRELYEYDEILKNIDINISIAKKKKFSEKAKEDINQLIYPKDIHEEELKQKNPSNRIDHCISCYKVSVDANLPTEEKICKLCKMHKRIGEILPKIDGIIFADGKLEFNNNVEDFVEISFDKFGAVYLPILKDKNKQIKIEALKEVKVEYFAINSTENFWKKVDISKHNISAGFKFIGNTAPKAIKGFRIQEREEPYREGDVLDFDAIADMSIGDKRLGILKMDIDNLGLIFAIGLTEDDKSDRTISRIATLSRAFDIFITGYINNICENIFEKWKIDPNNNCPYKDKIGNIIYITYSGGDDLFIIGPWSEIIELSKMMNNEFKDFTCRNPNITLSSGIFLCKPKFPVKRFAPLVGEILEKSKIDGKKRNTVFGETISWEKENGYPSFIDLLLFGEELFEAINSKKPENRLARGFVHRLLRIRKIRFKDETQEMDLRFIPDLIYNISRNVKKEAKFKAKGGDEKVLWSYLKEKLISIEPKMMEKIKIPASYALLKSRKEG